MSLDESVTELLEQGEKAAKAKELAKQQQLLNEQRQDRLGPRGRGADHYSGNGYNGFDHKNRYSAEREENDERRSRNSSDRDEGVVKNSDENGSANEGSSDRYRPQHYSGSVARAGRSSYRDYQNFSRFDDDRSYRPDRRGDRYNNRSRSRSPARQPRSYVRDRSPPRKEKSPDVPSADKDGITVFVSQLAQRTHDRHLIRFFTEGSADVKGLGEGAVLNATVVRDRANGRSKGMAYVEFKDEKSVEIAVKTFTGKKLHDLPMIVQPSDAQKNRQAKKAPTANGMTTLNRLYVGNIHFSVTPEDLRGVFSSHGTVKSIEMVRDQTTGNYRGFAFIEMSTAEEAKMALEGLNGFELLGRPLRVGIGNQERSAAAESSPAQEGSGVFGMGGRGTHAGGATSFERARRDARNSKASALDDNEVGGISLNQNSRNALMQKLARVDVPEDKAKASSSRTTAAAAEVVRTRCVVMKNMFDPRKTLSTAEVKFLEADVRQELVKQFGHLVHLGAVLDSAEAEIWAKFARTQDGFDAAEKAAKSLNGRVFDTRRIRVDYTVEALYNAQFNEASTL